MKTPSVTYQARPRDPFMRVVRLLRANGAARTVSTGGLTLDLVTHDGKRIEPIVWPLNTSPAVVGIAIPIVRLAVHEGETFTGALRDDGVTQLEVKLEVLSS